MHLSRDREFTGEEPNASTALIQSLKADASLSLLMSIEGVLAAHWEAVPAEDILEIQAFIMARTVKLMSEPRTRTKLMKEVFISARNWACELRKEGE